MDWWLEARRAVISMLFQEGQQSGETNGLQRNGEKTFASVVQHLWLH
jgi:hypothetical protein